MIRSCKNSSFYVNQIGTQQYQGCLSFTNKLTKYQRFSFKHANPCLFNYFSCSSYESFFVLEDYDSQMQFLCVKVNNV